MNRSSKLHQAFGVDPSRRQFYSLRQSRYEALAQEVSDLAARAARSGLKLSVIDVGCGTGTALRYLEAKPHFEAIILSGADLTDHRAYKQDRYEQFYVGDVINGYPQIPSNSFDVVICEQLLEHLTEIGVAIETTLARILKPGGTLIVGVPIFPAPLHILRQRVVPILDAIVRRKRGRSHLQAFSLSSFLHQMRQQHLKLVKVRGFRIVSGGILRPLENHRWWWRFNRWLGERVPAVCIEVQAILEKPPEPPPAGRQACSIRRNQRAAFECEPPAQGAVAGRFQQDVEEPEHLLERPGLIAGFVGAALERLEGDAADRARRWFSRLTAKLEGRGVSAEIGAAGRRTGANPDCRPGDYPAPPGARDVLAPIARGQAGPVRFHLQ